MLVLQFASWYFPFHIAPLIPDIIQNIGTIGFSDRKLSLFRNFQIALALSKWPRFDLKFCMVVSRSVIFKIRLVLEGSEILHQAVIPPISQCIWNKGKHWLFVEDYSPDSPEKKSGGECSQHLQCDILHKNKRIKQK
jgi:hypothetical protein